MYTTSPSVFGITNKSEILLINIVSTGLHNQLPTLSPGMRWGLRNPGKNERIRKPNFNITSLTMKPINYLLLSAHFAER